MSDIQEEQIKLAHKKAEENDIKLLKEENKKLKNGYCELKVKCNNGECDCTNEEYDGMIQANMRISLLLDDYKSRNEKAIEYINQVLEFVISEAIKEEKAECGRLEYLKDILQGKE